MKVSVWVVDDGGASAGGESRRRRRSGGVGSGCGSGRWLAPQAAIEDPAHAGLEAAPDEKEEQEEGGHGPEGNADGGGVQGKPFRPLIDLGGGVAGRTRGSKEVRCVEGELVRGLGGGGGPGAVVGGESEHGGVVRLM